MRKYECNVCPPDECLGRYGNCRRNLIGADFEFLPPEVVTFTMQARLPPAARGFIVYAAAPWRGGSFSIDPDTVKALFGIDVEAK